MLTLNQLKFQLIEYFKSHRQLNDVKYEDDFDFAADRQLTYPVCHLEYLNSQISEKYLNHSFKIVLADLMSENTKGIEDEIHSDLLQIIEDFSAWLADSYDFNFVKQTSLNKIVDDNGDRVAGIIFTIILGVIRSQNTCIAPIKN